MKKKIKMFSFLKIVWAGILSLLLLFPCSTVAQESSRVRRSQVDKAIAELEKAALQQINARALPGLAIGVIFEDKVVYTKGFGVREMGKPEEVTADTVFQLASVSKPIGASVIAALIGEGRITWDTKIRDLDPAFVMSDPWVTQEITIRDMYTHRSGLPPHAGDNMEDLGYDRKEVLHRLRYIKPFSSFRSHYAYTNFGLTEGAVAAARAYDLDWAEASEQKLYKPLGMNMTSSRFKDFEARPNKAVNHMLVDGKWFHKYQRNPDAQSPAGGVSSSVNDMTRWMRMQLKGGKFEGKQIVAAAPLAETQFPQMITGVSRSTGMATFYGLGWDVNYDEYARLRLTHSGGFALGAATRVLLAPAEQLGIVILTNAAPVGTAEGLVQTFFDTVLYGKSERDWLTLYREAFKDPAVIGLEKLSDYTKPPSPGRPALKNEAYAGTYGDNQLFGDIKIAEQRGNLKIIIGPQKVELPLTHYDRDTFTFETVGENAAGRSGATFILGSDGKAQSVVIESLNKYGQGLFHRVSNDEK